MCLHLPAGITLFRLTLGNCFLMSHKTGCLHRFEAPEYFKSLRGTLNRPPVGKGLTLTRYRHPRCFGYCRFNRRLPHVNETGLNFGIHARSLARGIQVNVYKNWCALQSKREETNRAAGISAVFLDNESDSES